MANIFEWDAETKSQWDEWVASRPDCIKVMCEKYPPNKLYRLKDNGQRVTLYSYSENGTVTVSVTGRYNFVIYERQVFGINPDDLIECDLPSEAEVLGAVITGDEEVEEFIEMQKEVIKEELQKVTH